MSAQTPQTLKRELGVFGATMLGLGSIVGTGVFVSIGIAADIAGPAVVLAVILGALVASFNGLSSAQLAANHAVSGGTYEYGYKFLTPALGFIAGWMFLLAKSASAATAALGFAGYILAAFGRTNNPWLVPLALVSVITLTLLVLSGIRRSNRVNTGIVSVTFIALAVFVFAGLPSAVKGVQTNFANFFGASGEQNSLRILLHATALMFVAYTGYGRIATLGEEVINPRRTIPKAIVITLLTTMTLYVLVALVGVGAVGVENLSPSLSGAAPLELAAQAFGFPLVPQLVALGAITAMLGVLLNLILGLSRVLLAMGRRRDMPAALGRLNTEGTTPTLAVLVMGTFVALLTLVGDVKTTWSFSAFTVLVYYAITNLAALFIPAEGRLFPKWVSIAGLIACAALAFFVEPAIWLLGLGLIIVGLIWHFVAQRIHTAGSLPPNP